ncbi:REP-associated tyrosine transposase [Flagellimonas pacifica]|nr:transposase [Allomuricauda parva]
MSRNYKFHNPAGVYFVSFATVYWIDVFIRQKYFEVLANSIDHCRKEKGMELFAYCFMPSHAHLIFRSTNNDPSGLLRDFKKHTSKAVIKAIKQNPRESRKEWMLKMFKKAGKEKKNVETYQFWQHHNKPIELWSPSVIKQKVDYIHKNPIHSGFVTNPEDWKYSSARNFVGENTVLEIDEIGFLS